MVNFLFGAFSFTIQANCGRNAFMQGRNGGAPRHVPPWKNFGGAPPPQNWSKSGQNWSKNASREVQPPNLV